MRHCEWSKTKYSSNIYSQIYNSDIREKSGTGYSKNNSLSLTETFI